MSLPGSKLGEMKQLLSHGAASSLKGEGIAVRRVVTAQPTILSAPVAAPEVTLAPKATLAPKTTLAPSENGFKRPENLPGPVKRPVSEPIQPPATKALDQPLHDSSRYAAIIDDQPAESKPLKKYAIANRKVWAGLAFSVFAILVTGFLVYLNLPDISVRVRASELGIAANLPSYKPAGYNVQGVAEVEDGVLSIKYTAETDQYTFTAQRSTLDPYQMADYAKNALENAESVFEGGLTIYLSGADALWANGGVLYTISGSGALTRQQIINIALAAG